MRKKVFLIAVLLLCSRAASGQVLISLLFGDKLNTGKIEFGLDGGMTLVRTDGLDPAGTLTTWNLGFYFDIKLKDPAWMVHTGVTVKSTLGADHMPVYSLNDPGLDEEFSGGSVTRNLNYFNVPLMIKFRTKSQIFVEGGVQLGLLHKAGDTFHGPEIPDGGASATSWTSYTSTGTDSKIWATSSGSQRSTAVRAPAPGTRTPGRRR